MTDLNNSTINSNIAVGNNSNNGVVGEWKEFVYENNFPVSTENNDRKDSEKLVTCKVLAGETIQFKIKNVTEILGKNLEYRFVSVLRNFFSAEKPLNHTAAFYRVMAVTRFTVDTGRYTVTHIKVDGETLYKGDHGLATNESRYLYSFLEEAINDSVYDKTVTFKDKEELLMLPHLYKCNSSVLKTPNKSINESEASKKKYELRGVKMFETRVDNSKEKFPVVKLKKDHWAGLVTDKLIVAFSLDDFAKVFDKSGVLQTNSPCVEKTSLNEHSFVEFVKEYC